MIIMQKHLPLLLDNKNIFIKKLSEIYSEKNLKEISKIYFEGWKQNNLCQSFDEAYNKQKNFDQNWSFVILKNQNPIGILNTIPFYFDSKNSLPTKFNNYNNIEQISKNKNYDENPNAVLCFSIATIPNIKIKINNEKIISLPEYFLKNLQINNYKKFTFSRFNDVPKNETANDFYHKNSDNKKMLGAAGMHEYFGAETLFVIENSRPEDLKGGKANVIQLYK